MMSFIFYALASLALPSFCAVKEAPAPVAPPVVVAPLVVPSAGPIAEPVIPPIAAVPAPAAAPVAVRAALPVAAVSPKLATLSAAVRDLRRPEAASEAPALLARDFDAGVALSARESEPPLAALERFPGPDVELTANVRSGRGMPVLFIPGLAGDLMFEHQARELLLNPRRPLVVLHRRDFNPAGGPEARTDGDPMEAAAADVAAGVEWFARRFGSKALLVAHSAGATVTYEVARDPAFAAAQRLIAGVMFTNPFHASGLPLSYTRMVQFGFDSLPWPARKALGFMRPEAAFRREEAFARAEAWIARFRAAESLPRGALRATVGGLPIAPLGLLAWFGVPRDVQTVTRTYLKGRPLKSILDEMQSLIGYPASRESEAAEAIRALGWRTLVVGNATDPLVHERSVERAARRLGAPVEIMDGDGWWAHAPMLDPAQRRLWNERLERFYAELLR